MINLSNFSGVSLLRILKKNYKKIKKNNIDTANTWKASSNVSSEGLSSEKNVK